MSWLRWFSLFSLGSDAGIMAGAIESHNAQQFTMGLLTLLHDIGGVAKVKELDSVFVESLRPDVESLAQKIFARLPGPAA